MEVRIIQAESRFSIGAYLRKAWAYRELVWFLARRDVKVKYAQTYLGLAWAILQPLLTALILSFIFQRVARVETQGIPGLLFTFSGMAAWIYVSNTAMAATQSVVSSQDLVKKVYFPRIVIPLSKAIEGLIDFAISLLFVAVLFIYYDMNTYYSLALLPVFILATMCAGVAASIWTSILTLRFRDMRFVIPFGVRLAMFATPIAYAADAIPKAYHVLYFLNPIAGLIEGYRWSFFGETNLRPMILLSMVVIGILLVTGSYWLGRLDRKIADIV